MLLRHASSVLPLPSNVIDYWIADKQLTMTSWIGQVRGIVVPYTDYAPLPGSITVDGSYFKGIPVARTTQTGSAGSAWWVQNVNSPVIAAANSHPFMYHVGRVVAYSSGQSTAALYTLTSSSQFLHYLQPEYQGSARYFNMNNFGVQFLTPSTDDLKPHRIKTWSDGTNAHCKIDETDYTKAGATTGISQNATGIGFGSMYNGQGAMNAFHAFLMICSSKPSASEELALDVWLKDKFGLTA